MISEERLRNLSLELDALELSKHKSTIRELIESYHELLLKYERLDRKYFDMYNELTER